MNMQLSFVVVLLLTVQLVQSKESWNKFEMEPECAADGGICVESQYCNEFSSSGLCPKNQKSGVECCNQCKDDEFINL